jgi:hypothetical protein
MLIVRSSLLVLLVIWTVKFAAASSADVVMGSFLHLVNLVFHEAGHVVFAPFGPFVAALGGSLMQLLIPLACAAALLTQAGDRFGAAVGLWWAGQNLVDLALYIGDARTLQLPLLGGATGAEVEGHDWEAILTALGWLHRDTALAAISHRLGVLIMVVALAAAAWVLFHRSSGLPCVPDAAPGHVRRSKHSPAARPDRV